MNKREVSKQLRIDKMEGAYKLFLRGVSTQEIASIYSVKEETVRKYVLDRTRLSTEYDKNVFGRVISPDNRQQQEKKYG